MASKTAGKAIVAPNNSGKTTFLRNHPEIPWEDQDDLLAKDIGMGAQARMYSERQLKQADEVTRKYKAQGTNMLVSAWWDFDVVDAFVIIDSAILEKRLDKATFEENQRQAKNYRRIAVEQGIPIYTSFEEATMAARGNGVFAMQSYKPHKLHYDEVKHPGSGQPRFVSKEKNARDEPVLVIDPKPDKVKLAFVRSSKPDWPLKELMEQYDEWAFEHGNKERELEDDALFEDHDTNCMFRALTHRLFTGKGSIYEKYGYEPVFENARCSVMPYTKQQLQKDMELVKGATCAWYNDTIVPILASMGTQAEHLHFPLGDNGTVGEMMLISDCETRRTTYNHILSANVAERNHPSGNAILKALCNLHSIYATMTMQPRKP